MQLRMIAAITALCIVSVFSQQANSASGDLNWKADYFPLQAVGTTTPLIWHGSKPFPTVNSNKRQVLNGALSYLRHKCT